MSKAREWSRENDAVAKRQPEKFLSGVVCALVKPSGYLQISVNGHSMDIPLLAAEELTEWMVDNYGGEFKHND